MNTHKNVRITALVGLIALAGTLTLSRPAAAQDNGPNSPAIQNLGQDVNNVADVVNNGNHVNVPGVDHSNDPSDQFVPSNGQPDHATTIYTPNQNTSGNDSGVGQDDNPPPQSDAGNDGTSGGDSGGCR